MTFAIWNTALPAVVFGHVIANGSYTSTPDVRCAQIAVIRRPRGEVDRRGCKAFQSDAPPETRHVCGGAPAIRLNAWLNALMSA